MTLEIALSWTEILNTKLLVSLHHSFLVAANMVKVKYIPKQTTGKIKQPTFPATRRSDSNLIKRISRETRTNLGKLEQAARNKLKRTTRN